MESTTTNDVKDRYFTCRSFLVLKGYSLLKLLCEDAISRGKNK